MSSNQATPGISFKIGSSHQDLRAVTDDLKELRAVLQALRDDAKGTADSFNALGKARPAPRPAPKGDDQAAYEQAVAQRRQATRAEAVRRATDPLEQQYAAHTAGQRQQRMQRAVAPTDQERQYQEIVAQDRRKMMEETIKRGSTRDTSMMARGMNALSWSPFMPQSTYLMQAMLGEAGLGLPLAGVAAGMGIAGFGAAGLGLNAYATNQARTGQQLVSATGAPPFSPNTFATPADEAKLLLQRTGAQGLNLPGNDGQEAVSALAAGGLTSTEAFGKALDQVGVLVNAFGMSVADAANFVTQQDVDLGITTQQVTQALEKFGDVAQRTAQPLAALGQIAAGTTNLAANLTNPNDQAATAAMYRAVGGSTEGALAVSNAVNSVGGPSLALGAQLGYTPEQFQAAKQTGAGQTEITERLVQRLQSFYQEAGGSEDIAMIRARALVGPSLDQATYDRLRKQGATVGTDAFTQAQNAPTPPLAPGSAANVNAQIASGNLAAASSTANPANVKDMAVTAAQVFLTGAISFGESYSHSLQSGANLTPAQLAQVRQGGGVAGAVAGGQSILERLADWTTGVGLNIHQHFAGGSPSGAPGGGGSTGGAVQHQVAITVDVRQGGVSVGSTPAPINVAIQNGQPSQQYRAYMQTTGRGQQYP